MKKRNLFLFSLILLNTNILAQDNLKYKCVKNNYFTKTYFNEKIIEKINTEDYKKGISKINDIRYYSGLQKFSENKILDKSSYNHGKYVVENQDPTHIEKPGLPYFTGEYPWDRAIKVGYNHKFVGEAFSSSYGKYNSYGNIDSLMTSIYHRIGLLTMGYDEIGAGYYGNTKKNLKYSYVYNIGNSEITKLCNSTADKPLDPVKDICKNDNKEISYENLSNAIKKIYYKQWKIVLFPNKYVNSGVIFPGNEVPSPFFNGEKISGYPISVMLNPLYYSNPKILEFKLYDANNNKEIPSVLLDRGADENGEFDQFEYAIFPKKGLLYNHKYYSVFKFENAGNIKTVKWYFYTKSLNKPYYTISSNTIDKEIKIKSNKYYYIYIKPEDNQAVINGITVGYNTKDVRTDFIDANTFKVYLDTDKLNTYAKFQIFVGNKTLNLKLIASNTELPKATVSNEEKHIPSSFYQRLYKNEGTWELEGADTNIDLTNYNNTVYPDFVIMKFKNGKWCIYSNNNNIIKLNTKYEKCDSIIKSGEAYFLKRVYLNINNKIIKKINIKELLKLPAQNY